MQTGTDFYNIDRLLTEPLPPDRERCRVVYVSPLKALAYDIERNLRAPLRGIGRTAALAGIDVPEIRVALRTGDTPADQRRSMLRRRYRRGDIVSEPHRA